VNEHVEGAILAEEVFCVACRSLCVRRLFYSKDGSVTKTKNRTFVNRALSMNSVYLSGGRLRSSVFRMLDPTKTEKRERS
jgi:hypothetical protein